MGTNQARMDNCRESSGFEVMMIVFAWKFHSKSLNFQISNEIFIEL
jgi:hypothetical protein